MDIKNIKELARVMKENELTALEIREGEAVLKLERKQEPAALSGAAQQKAPSPFTPAGAEPAPSQKEEGVVVASPTVGVFYAAPSPDSRPFVEVGDKVKKGDTLCIIEAMKLMNEIPAETDGTILEVCAANGQVVEYNQPLFRIG